MLLQVVDRFDRRLSSHWAKPARYLCKYVFAEISDAQCKQLEVIHQPATILDIFIGCILYFQETLGSLRKFQVILGLSLPFSKG
jgi:hypothetical protein